MRSCSTASATARRKSPSPAFSSSSASGSLSSLIGPPVGSGEPRNSTLVVWLRNVGRVLPAPRPFLEGGQRGLGRGGVHGPVDLPEPGGHRLAVLVGDEG